MNALLVNYVVCQHELFTRAAAELDRVIARLPADKVAEARANVQEMVEQGGVRPEKPKEKTGLQKGLLIMSGKAVMSDFKKE
jgi:hypothetical protein